MLATTKATPLGTPLRRRRTTTTTTTRSSKSSDLVDVERDAKNAGAASLRVSRAFSVAVPKAPKPAKDYVALPAKEYNLLDETNVQRVDGDGDDGFVVSAGRQKLLFLDVEPRGVVKVCVSEGGCVQKLVAAEIINLKPEDARSANVTNAINLSLKDLKLRNEVTATEESDGSERIRCQIDVAGDFREGVFARAGGRLNTILGWSLGAVMPWFLTQLAADYERWARDERRVQENASLTSVAAKIIAGSRGNLPEGVRESEVVPVDVV
jgi:hypothetical protein